MNTALRSTRTFLVAGLFAAASLAASAAPLSFDFKDPKGVNNVQFKLDAPLESITGTGTGISGTIAFDPANPEATTGSIVLDAASLTVGNPVMTDHMRGDKWLDVAKHKSITFEALKVSGVRKQGAQIVADVAGKLTLKGVTKEVTVPVSFTHLPDKLGARIGKADVKGDLLVVRATFEINRNDFGIMPGQAADKVAEAIHLSLSIAGAAKK